VPSGTRVPIIVESSSARIRARLVTRRGSGAVGGHLHGTPRADEPHSVCSHPVEAMTHCGEPVTFHSWCAELPRDVVAMSRSARIRRSTPRCRPMRVASRSTTTGRASHRQEEGTTAGSWRSARPRARGRTSANRRPA
jgi:hypothetical protein